MQILTYQATDSEAPEGLRAVASLILPGEKWGRWTAHGATPEEARAKLEKFWADAQPAERKPRASKAATAVAEDPGEVL